MQNLNLATCFNEGEQYQDFVMVQTLLDFAYLEAISNVTMLPESDSGWSWVKIKKMK
jgi:hypothetical protein